MKKNPNYRKICDLYDFLRHYDDVGYAIKIIEQNPQIDNLMVQNIYHNTLFQYIILKGYLEGEKERELPSPLKQKPYAVLRALITLSLTLSQVSLFTFSTTFPFNFTK